jgi:hypothetical protein
MEDDFPRQVDIPKAAHNSDDRRGAPTAISRVTVA